MTTSRRELLTSLAGAWAFASLAALPAMDWLGERRRNPPALAAGTPDDDLVHVMTRCGFGVRPSDPHRAMPAHEWLEMQLEPNAIEDGECERRLRRLESLALPLGEVYELHEHVARHELQAGVLLSAVYSARQLRESVVEFWRDHFSLSATKGECAWLATSFERDVLRQRALGTFRELLRGVLLHPAMLWYLDGRLNRADGGAPNENYARELLELHTLGLGGGYTQADVQEVARALSGWTSRALGASRKGLVEFDAARHDREAKRVLGRELPAGLEADEVERVVEIVCAHPSTALHVARKLCLRFIDDTPPPQAVLATAAEFTSSGGDLRKTLRVVVTREEFAASRRAKLKRPLHFVAAALRACDAECEPALGLLDVLERLGHSPYQWPTPDGYPADSLHWRGGMLWRWRFALDLARGGVQGARVDARRVFERAGGRSAFVARCLGRAPELEALGLGSLPDEVEALATVLAAPEFQRC